MEPAFTESLASSLLDLHEVLYDVRPQSADVAVAGDVVTCRYSGGLRPADEVVIEAGHADQVRQFREGFFAVVRPEFTELVEIITGRHVASFAPTFDPEERVTTIVFVLEDRFPSEDDREAIRNWSAQVRRNARRLRELHVEQRDLQRSLHETFRAQREKFKNEAERRSDEGDRGAP